MTIEQTTKTNASLPWWGLATAICWMLSACGGTPPPPPKVAEPVQEEVPAGPPEKEDLDSGMECVKAQALCEISHCIAEVKNDCEQAVTCEFEVLGLCQAGGSRGEARKEAHETIPAGSSTELASQPDCEDAAVVGTSIQGLSCH